MDINETYMHRCLELARLGAGSVAPNPMVGAVLVHKGRIIGEGWHQEYGKAHAEVNCINSVKQEDESLIASSTMYVSLEPCAHFGKTPPCCDLIIKNKIPRVVIGCRDPFKEVDGKGIEKLQDAGVTVVTGILEKECKASNRRFFTFHTTRRPYIILKWAQTADHKIAGATTQRLLISNELSNRLVHQWRSVEAAILVGTGTALLDNPSLDNRLWSGKSPVRMVIDRQLKLPASLNLFNGQHRTIVFNCVKQEEQHNLLYYRLADAPNLIPQIMVACYQLELQSIIIEGGYTLLQHFMDTGTWDEARIITNQQLIATGGLLAPLLTNALLMQEKKLLSDHIAFYSNQSTHQLIN